MTQKRSPLQWKGAPVASRHGYPWLNSLLSLHRKEIALALGLGLATYGCAALLMFASGYLISKTADPATSLFMVMTPIACVQLFGLGRPFARYAERLVSHQWVFRITSALRLKLFQAARRQTERGQGTPAGTYLGVLSDDIGHLQNLFLRVIFPVAIAWLLFLGASLLCGFFSWQLLLLMVLCGLACVFVLPYCALMLARFPRRKLQAAQMREYTMLTDHILGSADWILSGRAQEACQKHCRSWESLERERQRLRRRNRIIELVSVCIMGAILFLMICWCGEAYGGTGEQANWIAAFALGFFPLIEVFLLLPASLSQAPEHTSALKSINGFLAKAPGEEGDPAPEEKKGAFSSSAGAGTLVLDHVSCTYPGAKEAALRDVSLTIPPGQKVAILGRSGSGKTTLLSALRETVPITAGSIRLIDADNRAADPSQALGHLNQSPYILDRSLRENLTLGRTGITDEEMDACLKAVGLGEKLESLPAGLDTSIGERGVGFSGGEAHRLALARVLLGKHGILALDEPFSALDPATEQALCHTLFQVATDRTLIVVTHHLGDIDRFDRVIFLEDGAVILDGSPSQLRANSEHFRSLLAFDF